MKSIYILTLLSFFVIVINLSSCDQSIDNLYTEKSRIQFKYFKEDTVTQGQATVYRRTYFDRTTLSFGMSDDEVQEDTAKIVVEFLGDVSNKDRTYRVRINPDSTTAKEGVHYKPFSSTQTFRAGRRKDTLSIVVLRKDLGTSFINPVDYRLTLDMEATEDFNLGMKDGLYTHLYMNNYLVKPKWWDGVGSLMFYHPKKWKILISFNEKWANKEKEPFNFNNGGREYFEALRNYLEREPTFDDETGARIYIDRLVEQNN
ncbi:DUF4843 domain-containing protein [Sphingobacterium tabacisoli]|uniref:DUF4843 domain-containing protein n=1 Tax=Sphingobacterium tabacisoli TaxID=2044855 RepID=A0ABW5KY11_9SPHI|nr:DUF4843 domain-containing protein [Sphingobacterium tabacisoli]